MEVPNCLRRSIRKIRITWKRKIEQERDPDHSPPTSKTVKRKAAAVTANNKVAEVDVKPNLPAPEVLPPPLADKEKQEEVIVPPTPPPKKKPWEERRVIRRSKKLEEDERRPYAAINLIDRDATSIEDSKVIAAKARKKREEALKKTDEEAPKLKRKRKSKTAESAKKEGTKKGKKKCVTKNDDKMDSDSESDSDAEKESFSYNQLRPIAGEEPLAHYLEKMALVDSKNFSLDNLPNFVMGTGRGEVGGPPAFDYKSLWNYELTPCNSTDTTEEILKNLPWRTRDPRNPDFMPEILSIVATFSVGRDLDLEKIANSCYNLEYNPDRFASLIMRIPRKPKTTALIFASGKIIVTGARSEELCRKAARQYARIIQKVAYLNVKVIGLQIQNISARCHLGFKVRLNHLCRNRLYGCVSYEPELFPGLIIDLEYPKVKAIIFCTGSVLMTGAKSENALKEAFKSIYPLVRMYSH